jgi:hypothetical protein
MKQPLRNSLRGAEVLESRLVPSSSQLWIDGDGDKVRFFTSKGDLTGHISQSFPNSAGVFSMDISDSSFYGTNLVVSVNKAKTGDGLAIIGHIKAGANNLNNVTIKGDLGDIDASGGTPTVPAIKSLTVDSFGSFGQRGDGNKISLVVGNVGTLVVKHDFNDSYFHVDGSLGSVSVGGSLIGGDAMDGGEIYASVNVGKVAIGHDIRGGDGPYSGSVGAGVNMDRVSVGGSVIGGSGPDSGEIYGTFAADGRINNISVVGSLIGGDGANSGDIIGFYPFSLGVVTIGHDIVGGHGRESANVWAKLGTLDQLTVKGSVIGGYGDYSGEISVYGTAGKISIGGSVYGGSGYGSAEIDLESGAKSLSIGGSLLGGKGDSSAEVDVTGGPLELLKIGRGIRGGSGDASAEVSGTIRMLVLSGSVIPGTGTDSGKIG